MEKRIMTKRVAIEGIMEIAEVMANPGFKEYLELELKALDRKAERKPDEKAIALREKLKTEILSALVDAQLTATELSKAIPTDASTQKLTPILTEMVENGSIIKVVEKRVGRYKLA